MGELVQASAIEKTLASKLIAALVRRGFVERHIGVEDARQIQLSLREEGIALVRKAEPLGKELEARFLDCLSAREIQTMRQILQKLIDSEAASKHAFDAHIEKLIERKSSST
jgi:DNA-binding MarR family transcriptional regulator